MLKTGIQYLGASSDPAIDGEAAILKLPGWALDRQDLMQMVTGKEHDAVMQGLHQVKALGGLILIVPDHTVEDLKLASREAFGLTMEIIDIGQLPCGGVRTAVIIMNLVVMPVVVAGQLCFDIIDREGSQPQIF